MKLALVFAALFSLISFASTQTPNIRIQATPPTVDFREDDLVLLCTIPNPSQLKSVFTIELQKNASTLMFASVVTVATGETDLRWGTSDSTIQTRATATGNVDSPSTAQLRFTINKDNVVCPSDFLMYRCIMSGLSSTFSTINEESTPITIEYNVKPTVIEMPRVRILNDFNDTPNRQFPVGTAIQLTCQGQVGNDPSRTIRWCAKKANEFSFVGLAQTPIHSEASLSGCQYTRSSTITYNLTSEDTYTQFLCESGDTGLCGTGSAIQYVNITLEGSGTKDQLTSGDNTSDAGIIAGGVIGGLAALILIILLIYFLVLRRKSDGESSSSPPIDHDRTKEDVPGYNGPANPEGPVYSVPVKDNPPERQHPHHRPRKHPRDEEDRRKYRGHENDGLDDEHTPKTEKEEIDYQNHGYSNRMMNDYGDDGDVQPRGGGPGFGSAV